MPKTSKYYIATKKTYKIMKNKTIKKDGVNRDILQQIYNININERTKMT